MRKSRNYWTIETCKKIALKFNSRSEFKREEGGAYNAAKKLKILDEVCSHMIVIGNRFKRLVYVFNFSDNNVYVGLTKNIEERKNKHMRDIDSSVYKHIQKTGINPTLECSDYMFVSDAVLLEKKTIENYRNSGYTILNIAKAGAVGGGNMIWTYEMCKQEALKYEQRKDFARQSNSAYNSARKNNWLNKICVHMKIIRQYKNPNYWTQERCKKVAKKCKTRNEFCKKYSGAYMASLKNGWIQSMCAHMPGKGKKPNNYWTKEMCHVEALKYNSYSQFRKNCNSVYTIAIKKDWIKDICTHMKFKS